MRDPFPIMIERPENRLMGGGLTYWFFAFSVFPCMMFLIASDIFSWHEWVVWIEIVYHLLNFAVTLFLFFTFIKESFIQLQVNTKEVLSAATTCALLILAYKRGILFVCGHLGWELGANVAFGSFVTSEMDMLRYASDWLYFNPVIGSLVLIILSPVTISCLYYACCFAPACNRWPRGAYLVMSLALLIPRIANFWPMQEELTIYLITLPTHLIACWGYQKTDTIWTPIIIHAITNLAACILQLHSFGHI